ncbi:MAG: methionine synthase [Rikenellaceae bacterium]
MIKESIEKQLQKRILILDGALGTMIQGYGLGEEDYRGQEYKDSTYKLLGCNDLLVKTAPHIISEIHENYLKAGADIITTDTFNANYISLSDYGQEDKAYELNFTAVTLARELADKYTLQNPTKPRYVAGSVGPTNKTASISADVNNPAKREVSFDYLSEVYYTQVKAMADAGVDIYIIETIFDTLNAKAAIFALKKLFTELRREIPIMISGTLTDKSGRTLSGQVIEAFYNSISHARPLSVGLNCSFGADDMRTYIATLSKIADCNVSAHPNAGLPNVLGNYDQSAEAMGTQIKEYLEQGLLNIVGGCCGTTPLHIAEIARLAQNYSPRKTSIKPKQTILSGLETLEITPQSNFINIGERSNVAGSAKFARLIREKKYDEALDVVKHQVISGAQVVDVCMDDGLLDAKEEMINFLNYMGSDPEISRVPVMIDSSKWEVLEAGLKCTQGKSIVNSISLKEGETEFISHAKTIQNLGAAAVVMLFDEQGQGDSFERKIRIAERAYNILTTNNFPAEDIIFDPNVLSVATGISEHDNYGVDFINACAWIKQNLPGAKLSGGISNLSFSFRGHNTIREAMHSVFLYHAIAQGLDMGIVNPAMLQIYSDIEPNLLTLCEDVVLNRHKDATENLSTYANNSHEDKTKTQEKTIEKWRSLSLKDRIAHALIKGNTEFIEEDTLLALSELQSPIKVIDEILMPAMGTIGELFGEGKMFLPQVVKSARVMKASVGVLTPYIEAENAGKSSDKGRILIATVKGDVHDIGKNIISVVMACNGYLINDLGVMVECDKIVDTALEWGADAIGLSGLITPSLDQMCQVLGELEKRGLNIPVIVGGATTSAVHTAVKMTPLYKGTVIHGRDASHNVMLLSALLSSNKDEFIAEQKQKQKELRDNYNKKNTEVKLKSLAKAREDRLVSTSEIITPKTMGRISLNNYPISRVIPNINWGYFFAAWQVKQNSDEAKKLYADAVEMLREIEKNNLLPLSGALAIHTAQSKVDDIIIDGTTTLAQLRNEQSDNDINLSLSDFISSTKQDYIASFAITSGTNLKTLSDKFKAQGDDYKAIMIKLLADRLAEAFAVSIHQELAEKWWGFSNKSKGLRVAFGYESCPDHSLKEEVFSLLDIEKDTAIRLNESYMIEPGESICGLIFANADAKYFDLGKLSDYQLEDYAQRRDKSKDEIKKIIANF